MQRNHSHRAASLVKPLRSVPSVPSQPPSTHLTPIAPPHRYRRGGERDALADPVTGSTNHRDPRGFTTQRFCFKNKKKQYSDYNNSDNSCMDATAQTGTLLFCSVDAKPPRLSKATGSTKREFSPLLLNFIVIIMNYHYDRCYYLVHHLLLLFLIIVLTPDISFVLNGPAPGLHYFHNRYVFLFLLFFIFIGYFSTRDMYF